MPAEGVVRVTGFADSYRTHDRSQGDALRGKGAPLRRCNRASLL